MENPTETTIKLPVWRLIFGDIIDLAELPPEMIEAMDETTRMAMNYECAEVHEIDEEPTGAIAVYTSLGGWALPRNFEFTWQGSTVQAADRDERPGGPLTGEGSK